MEEALLKELEDLRTENQILRASLEEVRREEPAETAGTDSLETVLKEWAGKLNLSLEQIKAQLAGSGGKISDTIAKQLETNPIPVLLAAFGAGYILSRILDRR